MIQKCEFNPVCDIERVSPEGALDLCKAYALGSIPSTLESADSDYDGIEEPASIIGKPVDVFEGLQADKVIQARGKESEDTE